MLVPGRMLSVGGICVAGVVTSPPGKEPGKATTTESHADRAARLPPISIALCRIDPAKRSKKWLSTLARTPPTPTGSVAGDPREIVTPPGRRKGRAWGRAREGQSVEICGVAVALKKTT